MIIQFIKYCELEKQIVDLEHENCRIDALDVFFLSYDILEYLEIREILGNGEPDSS